MAKKISSGYCLQSVVLIWLYVIFWFACDLYSCYLLCIADPSLLFSPTSYSTFLFFFCIPLFSYQFAFFSFFPLSYFFLLYFLLLFFLFTFSRPVTSILFPSVFLFFCLLRTLLDYSDLFLYFYVLSFFLPVHLFFLFSPVSTLVYSDLFGFCSYYLLFLFF
jgi:hypothetical protein